jgi:hypothetical protein
VESPQIKADELTENILFAALARLHFLLELRDLMLDMVSRVSMFCKVKNPISISIYMALMSRSGFDITYSV